MLTLLRPHLHQAYLDAGQRRHPAPRLTSRQKDLLRLLAAGHTNSQIARRLGISEGTVRTHLENIYEWLTLRIPCRGFRSSPGVVGDDPADDLVWVVAPAELAGCGPTAVMALSAAQRDECFP